MVFSDRYLAFNKKECHLFSVVCPQNVGQDQLKPLILKCLKENPSVKKICFSKEGDDLACKVEAEEGEKTLFQGREEPQLMRLGIAAPLPLKVKTVDCVYRRLHKKWKSPYTVIDFFLSLVLYPVALLSCLVYPDKEINKQLQKYIDSQTPSSFDALCRLLKQRKEMVARWGKQTVELDKVLSLALEMKRTDDWSSICQKALQEEGEVVFPGGYYQEEEAFAPVIYRVGPKDQEGKRALEIYFLAPPFEKVICTPLKEEKLHSLLVSLLAKSFPKEEKDSAKQAQVFFQAAQQGLSSDAAKRGMKKEAEQDVESSFRDHLLSPVQIETREAISGSF